MDERSNRSYVVRRIKVLSCHFRMILSMKFEIIRFCQVTVYLRHNSAIPKASACLNPPRPKVVWSVRASYWRKSPSSSYGSGQMECLSVTYISPVNFHVVNVAGYPAKAKT